MQSGPRRVLPVKTHEKTGIDMYTLFAYSLSMEFIEAPAFTRHDLYKELQAYLMVNPEGGDVIQGTGGFRKLRWSDNRRKKGKRGGLRIIYYIFPADDQIWFLTLYDKSEADDLTTAQKRILKEAIDTEKQARVKRRKFRRIKR